MEIRVFKGNIVDACSDAIVLPANTSLKEGSGASTAIFEAAGRRKLKAACSKIGHCDVGGAAVTPGFNLVAEVIVHAVVPKWIDGNHDEYALLSSAYLASLNIADYVGCKSIAFPLLASGNNGFDLGLAFDIAHESIEKYEPQNLTGVQLILYGNRAVACAEGGGYTCNDLVVQEKDFISSSVGGNVRSVKGARGERAAQLLKDGAGAMADFAMDIVEKGIEYMQDEDNRKKIIELGLAIATKVLKS